MCRLTGKWASPAPQAVAKPIRISNRFAIDFCDIKTSQTAHWNFTFNSDAPLMAKPEARHRYCKTGKSCERPQAVDEPGNR